MIHFLVNVKVYDPFPKEYEYREEATSIQVAIHRGLNKFRQKEFKGRPLKTVTVTATLIGSIKK